MALFKNLKKLVYTITTDTSGVKKGAKDAEKAFGTLNTKAKRNIKDIQISFAKFGIAMAAVGTAIGVVFAKIAKDSIKAAGIQELADAKLLASINNLKDAREGAFKRLKSHAAELQKVTAIGDEQIENNQALLATFQLNEEAIKELMPRILDMGAGNAELGQTTADLKAITLAVGKSFTMGIGALSRYGVAMTDAEQKAFQMASQQDKVRILNEILDNNFKGQAAAIRTTYIGQMEALKNTYGDIQEVLGVGLLPMLKDLTKYLEDQSPSIVGWIESWEALVQQVLNISAPVEEVKSKFKEYFKFMDDETKLAVERAKREIEIRQSVVDKEDTLWNKRSAKSRAWVQTLKDQVSSAKGLYIQLMRGAVVAYETATGKVKELGKETAQLARTTNSAIEEITQETITVETLAERYGALTQAIRDYNNVKGAASYQGGELPFEMGDPTGGYPTDAAKGGTAIQGWMKDLPEFSKTATSEMTTQWTGFFDSFKTGWTNATSYAKSQFSSMSSGMASIGEDIGNIFLGLFDRIEGAMSDFFYNMMAEGMNLKEAWKQFVEDVKKAALKALSDIAAKAIITIGKFALFSEGGVAGLGGGSLPSFSKGGVIGDLFGSIKDLPKAAKGLITTGYGDKDNIPALLKPNEVVMPFEWIGDFFKKSAENLFKGYAMPKMPQLATAGGGSRAPIINLSVNVDGTILDDETKLDMFVRKIFNKLEEHAYPFGIRNQE